MDMDNAAVFLAGSILYALGLIVILAGIIVANNLIHKYWKSFGWTFIPYWASEPPHRFATPEEAAKIAPTMDTEKVDKH
jgi:cytochrome b561